MTSGTMTEDRQRVGVNAGSGLVRHEVPAMHSLAGWNSAHEIRAVLQ
jgi:hypothetical protein